MVTLVSALTRCVVMVKAGETVAPAGTTTEAGGFATSGSELASVTLTPAEGAALLRVTVLFVVDPPPVTLEGESVMAVSTGCGRTVSEAVCTVPVELAPMVTVVGAVWAVVVMANLPDVCPLGIVMLAGTSAAALSLLLRIIFAP